MYQEEPNVQQRIKVLMYHRIVPNGNGATDHWTCVRLEEFRSQLQILDRLGFTTITFHDYRLAQEGELELPLKPIILTFDDGYADIFDTALPAMQALGMKGVVFVLGNRKVQTNYWDQRNGIPHARLMTTEEIRRLRSSGFEIGSHSMNHPNLASICEDHAWREIADSRSVLETIFDCPVETFSYPYGLSTPRTRQMVADAGYSHACGVYTGPPSLDTSPYDIRRMTISRGLTALGFMTRLLTPYERLEWMKRKAELRLNPEVTSKNDKQQPAPVLQKKELLWSGSYLASGER
jgi:peptidoglycan/xylan/chitin deacetylase (PgdA/CDA1 family)